MKVKLTNIFTKERMSAKTGKPFTSMSIKTEQHGDKWLSGFKGKENEHWRQGDEVDIIFEQKGEYLNFSVPKSSGGNAAEIERRLSELEKKSIELEKKIASFGNNFTAAADGEDVPF